MSFENFHIEPLPNFNLKIYDQKHYFGIKTHQWFYMDAFRDIRKLHREKRIDAVISRDPESLPYLAKLKRSKHIAVFYQPHNFYVDLSARSDVEPAAAKKYHLLEKKFIPKMTGVLCLQDTQAELFKKAFPSQKIFVASPGVLRTQPHAGMGFQRRLIGYVGSFQLNDGIETLLQAFKILVQEKFKVIMVGGRNQHEMAGLKQRIYELGLEDKILITSWVSYAQVEIYLEKISVGLIPLNDNFYNRYLTAPNKLFDYLSRGIPVVASDFPSIRNFISEGNEGLFVPPEHPEALAAAIKKIFADEETYEAFHARARKSSIKYLWEHQARNMIAQIEKCLK